MTREEELNAIAEHLRVRGAILLPTVTDPIERALEIHREERKIPFILRQKRKLQQFRERGRMRRNRW